MTMRTTTLCGLWMAGAIACAPPPSDEADTDALVDDTPPAMTAWMMEAFPTIRSCTLDLTNGETDATGWWKFYDLDGWPIAELFTIGGPAEGGSIAPSALLDPNLSVYVTRLAWNADHTKATAHYYIAMGADLTTDDLLLDVYRLDEAGRVVAEGLEDGVLSSTYDATGRKTSWDADEPSYSISYAEDGARTTWTNQRDYACVAEFPDAASVTSCTGTDTRCDYPEDGGDPACIEGDFSREATARFDADGYLASVDTTTTGLPQWGEEPSETLVTEEEHRAVTWSNGHTIVMQRAGADSWIQSVFASAERARASFDTVEPTCREPEGLLLEVRSHNYTRTVLSGEDCDLERVPEAPRAMVDALIR